MDEEIKKEEVIEETRKENAEADNATKTEAKTESLDPKKDARENKWWGVLSYLGVLVILPLLIKKDSDFAQFHAKQGVILLFGWMLSWLPFGPIIALIVVVLSIIGIVNALRELKKDLPIVGELAEKLKF